MSRGSLSDAEDLPFQEERLRRKKKRRRRRREGRMDPCGSPPGSPRALAPFPSAFSPEEGPAAAKAGVLERKARGSGKLRRSGKRGAHPPPPPSSSSSSSPPPPPPSEALLGAALGGKQVQRSAANARERARMRVLSKAFSRLKTTLPWVPPDTKLSKLDTLRLASSYIAHLRQVLAGSDKHQDGGYAPPVSLTWPFMVAAKPENDLKEAVNAARLCGPTAS